MESVLIGNCRALRKLGRYIKGDPSYASCDETLLELGYSTIIQLAKFLGIEDTPVPFDAVDIFTMYEERYYSETWRRFLNNSKLKSDELEKILTRSFTHISWKAASCVSAAFLSSAPRQLIITHEIDDKILQWLGNPPEGMRRGNRDTLRKCNLAVFRLQMNSDPERVGVLQPSIHDNIGLILKHAILERSVSPNEESVTLCKALKFGCLALLRLYYTSYCKILRSVHNHMVNQCNFNKKRKREEDTVVKPASSHSFRYMATEFAYHSVAVASAICIVGVKYGSLLSSEDGDKVAEVIMDEVVTNQDLGMNYDLVTFIESLVVTLVDLSSSSSP